MTEVDKLGLAIVRDFGDFIFSKSQQNIVDMEISDTGALLLSGEIREERGNVIIEYTAPYAQNINDGTQRHHVDPQELVGWVRRKLDVKAKDVLKVAKRIAEKIAKFGTKPKPFFDNAIAIAKEEYKGKINL